MAVKTLSTAIKVDLRMILLIRILGQKEGKKFMPTNKEIAAKEPI